jgi:two-component system cell cycle sensor histidine kinase/response regulator CckA
VSGEETILPAENLPQASEPAPIHVLICEDCDDDAVLIAAQLRRDGLAMTYERVDTAADTARALREHQPDVVISDVSMPAFSAEEALEVLTGTGLDVPFILVSGQIGEESAVALLRGGAHDFVLKARLARLAPAVRRELREAQSRHRRRQAEIALRESEQRFRLFAEHAKDIIFRYQVDPEAQIEYLSPATIAILGRPPDQLSGDPDRLLSAVDPGDRLALEASWRSPDPKPLVVRWHRPDGTPVWTEQRAVAVHDDSGRLVAVEGILRDITEQITAEQERARLELQLRQAERLEAVGQLAGGVAHDFNNLLGIILATADIATDELPPGAPTLADLAVILRAAERGAALTRQLLIFSRLEPAKLETLDLNAVIADTERLLRRTIGEDLEFRTILAADLPPIRIDRTRLEQILVNLVVNSRAAMPGGGQLTIHTAAPTTTGTEPSRPMVTLSVTDTGCGMTPEVVRRVFEPFFTTKGPGGGTGLGLSTVYGAVKEAGGEIDIVSSPGAGTTFRVQFPAADPAEEIPVGAAFRPADLPPPPEGGQTILLVEDDTELLEAIKRILTHAGYLVVAASTATDASHTIAAREVCIDALLTDVVMPGTSGLHLAEQARRDRPALPILFMSGYSTGSLPGGTALPANAPLIRKPFTGPVLLAELRATLDRARPAGPATS